MRMSRSLAALALAVAVVALGTAAANATTGANAPGAHVRSASTYVAQFDAQPPPGEPWAFLKIFPDDISVHQGDVIAAAFSGQDTPHTPTFVNTSDPEQWRADNQCQGCQYSVVAPDSATGGDDPNEFVINPPVAFPSSFTCGDVSNPCSFDGTSVVNGGISFPGQPDFYTAVNAPPGHYSMLCLLHPGMEIRIDVKRSDQSVPPPSKVAAKAAAQVQQATTQDGPVADAQAQQVSTSSIGNGHVQWTINAGGFSNNVTANEYLSSGVTIHVGDQLQVVGTGEIHTATTPFHSVAHVPFVVTQCEVPGPDIPAQSPADCPDPSEFRIAFNSKALFPSRTHALTDPTRFVSSGLLPGPGASATFDARTPGTYRFVCLVHGPSMSTTITVVS